MPGHGDHREALYATGDYVEKIPRDFQEARLVGSADCVDVQNSTDRTEKVLCFRWGSDRLVNQILAVTNSPDKNVALFSAYPVVLDGALTDVTVTKIEPWEYGIEGWVEGSVTNAGASICFFDTMYFAGTDTVPEGAVVSYQLAGLAYSLRPIELRSFEISEGPLWEMEKQRRLDEGESPEEASRPVELHMTGAAIFLPRSGDSRDEAEFQGVIDAIDTFEHDGQKVYRLEMELMRPGDEKFRVPVYASERVLDGYVPRLGDDLQGVMWLQGRRIGADADLNAQRAGNHTG